jgi:hypothetical protein
MKGVARTRALRAAALATTLIGTSVAAARSQAFDTAGRPVADLGNLSARIVAAEGGPGQNPLSSASGYGQFLSGTWLEIFRRAYPHVAQIMSPDQILALREIRPLAEDLTNRYAQANAATLQRVGLPATEGALSLAHAVGPGGAVSVLTALPARPAADLLSPEAIAANPFFKDMTANALRQWAVGRVGPQAERQPPEGAAPSRENAPEPLAPAEDFRIDNRTRASEVLATSRNATGVLHEVIEAMSRAGSGNNARLGPSAVSWLNSLGVDPARLLLGDPAVVRSLNRHASRVVLEAIRSVSSRPAYGEFKAIDAKAGTPGELPPAVIRAVAAALLDKMRRETATIADIVQHRRGVGATRPTAEHSGSGPRRDAANASAPTIAAPPL